MRTLHGSKIAATEVGSHRTAHTHLYAVKRTAHCTPQARVRISTCPAEHSDSVAPGAMPTQSSPSVHGSTQTQPNHLLRVLPTVTFPAAAPVRVLREPRHDAPARTRVTQRSAMAAGRRYMPAENTTVHGTPHASTSRRVLEQIISPSTPRPCSRACCVSRTVVDSDSGATSPPRISSMRTSPRRPAPFPSPATVRPKSLRTAYYKVQTHSRPQDLPSHRLVGKMEPYRRLATPHTLDGEHHFAVCTPAKRHPRRRWSRATAYVGHSGGTMARYGTDGR
jgi:hypothetical protein